MSNINSGQFINSFINSFNRAVSQGAMQNNQTGQTAQGNQTANTASTAAGGTTAANSVNQNGETIQNTAQQNFVQTFLPKTAAQITQTFSELASLNGQQTVNMLKDLLNLPGNFEQLLNQITSNTNLSNRELGLLLLASSTDFGRLSALLQNGSKEAMTNLYQLLAQYNTLGVSMKDEQLSILTKYISFVSASSAGDAQTLKTTMLLYLPWLPLTPTDEFKLELVKKDKQSGKNSDDSVTILIETEHFGNLQADIYKTAKDGIKIESVTTKDFPWEDFIALMKEESRKYSININFEHAQQEAANREKPENSKTHVFINTSPGVNPFLLLISNAFINNVHKTDTKAELLEQRKEKLKNGEN